MTIKKTIIAATAALSLVLSNLAAVPALAATDSATAKQYGPWTVLDLVNNNSLGTIESVKVDRNLVAWTEVNELQGKRYLRAWDGSSIRLLAVMNVSDWRGSDYYPAVSGNYDVADGVVVWVANDGHDQEIFALRNGQPARLTDNTHTDSHPVTSRGRIAWTAEMGSVYKLMVSDSSGERALDQYHVLNYAFSGGNLYWMNIVQPNGKFQVRCNDGVRTNYLSEAEVRPFDYDYFVVDGEGGAAWEVLRQDIGDYGMNLIYASADGTSSREVFRRTRWFYEPVLLDTRAGSVLVSVHDVQTKRYLDDVSLIETNGYWEATVSTSNVTFSAQYTDDAHVRHSVPYSSSTLIVRHTDGLEGVLSYDRVRLNVYDAADDVIVAARNEGHGVLLYADRKVTVVPTDADVRTVVTNGDTAAWTYEVSGKQVLSVAVQSVLVGNSSWSSYVTGRLVKSDISQSVYLATATGDRYVFPGEGQFYSWYDSFDSLQTVSADELAAMPLKGSVLYPARTLVKTPSSPEVYTVGTDGTLHWVTDGLVLSALYGDGWNRQVHDLPAPFLAAYRVGTPVRDTNGYYSIAAAR